jgi:hypothetical protein
VDPEVWQVVVSALVPTLTLVGVLLTRAERTPALYRKLRHSSTALKELPADLVDAREAVAKLVVLQAERIHQRETTQVPLRQRIDWYMAGWAIGGTVVTPVLVWGLWAWAAGAGSDWAFGIYTASILLAILGVFVSVGWWREALNPPSPKQPLKDDAQTPH